MAVGVIAGALALGGFELGKKIAGKRKTSGT